MNQISVRDCLLLLNKMNCKPDILFHSLHVARKALSIAKEILNAKNSSLDLNLVFCGGLLHDIGRCKTHGINHGIKGAEIISKHLEDEKLARIAERHIGGGIPKEEAVELDLPEKDFLPQTLTEKIVCYADKLFQYEFDENHRIVAWKEYDSVNEELKRMKKKLGKNHPAIDRLKEIESEIRSYY